MPQLVRLDLVLHHPDGMRALYVNPDDVVFVHE